MRRLCVIYFVLPRCFEQSQCFVVGSERAELHVAEDVLLTVTGDVPEEVPPLLPHAQDEVMNDAAGVRCHLILSKVRGAD